MNVKENVCYYCETFDDYKECYFKLFAIAKDKDGFGVYVSASKTKNPCDNCLILNNGIVESGQYDLVRRCVEIGGKRYSHLGSLQTYARDSAVEATSIPSKPSFEIPKHYDFAIQPTDYMKGSFTRDEYRGFLKGNIIKYVSRYHLKDGVKDLRKCRDYLEKLIELEGENGKS